MLLQGKTEEEIDQTLGRILGLFRFVVGKDMFMAFYQNCLARRLLHQKSASHDSEKLVVAKLKHGPLACTRLILVTKKDKKRQKG